PAWALRWRRRGGWSAAGCGISATPRTPTRRRSGAGCSTWSRRRATRRRRCATLSRPARPNQEVGRERGRARRHRARHGGRGPAAAREELRGRVRLARVSHARLAAERRGVSGPGAAAPAAADLRGAENGAGESDPRPGYVARDVRGAAVRGAAGADAGRGGRFV